MTTLSDILETTDLKPVANGFVFTEGPLWHPDGFFYFADVRASVLYRIVLGQPAQKVRDTQGGNGTTFDLQGRLINCEGDARRVTRTELDGSVTVLIDRFVGKRLNRPNDVICTSDGSLLFTDPSLRCAAGGTRGGKRRHLPHRTRRQRVDGSSFRVSEWPGAVGGRTHPVRREHALDPVYPRD